MATLKPGEVENALRYFKLAREEAGDLCDKIFDQVGGPISKGNLVRSSTDVGDVSQITPTGQFSICCRPLGIDEHSWQNTASCGSDIGFKGVVQATKVLALTALDLMTKPNVLRAAHDEFEKVTGAKKYVSPLPEGVTPPTRRGV